MKLPVAVDFDAVEHVASVDEPHPHASVKGIQDLRWECLSLPVIEATALTFPDWSRLIKQWCWVPKECGHPLNLLISQRNDTIFGPGYQTLLESGRPPNILLGLIPAFTSDDESFRVEYF